ncbi:HAMP domain-containing sensor histidine kinase [uncultured Tateyamaria sp.]|uniref:sensor histidine kinase n=1 Tax=uncultured Tateyamaria sp. TaxID=455651 RepID=UPI0026361049|nr:HAMP domain-containing sensor histidine kinase [uncultured Tateyamaria sp.]
MNMMSAPRALRNGYSQDVERTLAMLPEGADVDSSTLSAAFLASPYACFLLDHDARILVCNRRAERMYSPRSIPNDDGMRGLGLHELTRLTEEETANALRAGAARSSIELPMQTTSQTSAVRPTVFRVALLRSRHRGERLYLLTQDHLKAAADALGQMNRRRIEAREDLAQIETRFVDLHASLIAMESFAHHASHDLRTPLSTLAGMLQLMSGKFAADLPDKAREYLDVMQRAVAQMDALTSDFLEHARSVSAEVSAEPVDLHAALDDVRRDVLLGLTTADLTIRVTGPDCTLMAEPTLLRMLLMNLLGNAIKYRNPAHALRIDVTVAPDEDNATRLIIADNGRGFDPAERENIFLAFHRADTLVAGTGMGLSTCREVCRRHGWEIAAQSDGRTGATFTIRFPQTQCAA